MEKNLRLQRPGIVSELEMIVSLWWRLPSSRTAIFSISFCSSAMTNSAMYDRLVTVMVYCIACCRESYASRRRKKLGKTGRRGMAIEKTFLAATYQ